jgi:molybdopterin-dependent oxidoreductase alpha subunit
VQVQIGGDQHFFVGLAKAVLELDAAAARTAAESGVQTVKTEARTTPDLLFLADRTDNFFAWRDHVLAVPWPEIVEGSGVDEATIRRIADRYATAKATIACWAMGLTQHKHSVAMIQELVNVMLLRGNVGRQGAGLCPVRGHSNVQGDRSMGIDHHVRHAFLDRLGATFGFEPPRIAGHDTVATIAAMERGDVRAFVLLGGNFLSASPDTDRTARALERCTLTASISTKLNRTHLYPGARAFILPCLARSEVDHGPTGEQFVTVEDSMSMVHRSQGTLPPASEQLRSEPAIVAALGEALLPGQVAWRDLAADYDQIRDKIARVIEGCADYNARVRTPDGFQLPNTARDGTFAKVGGRARFTVSTLPDLRLPPGRLRMMTIRSHDQYNTTIYGLDDRYRGIRGERRVVFMNAADMVERGLVERQIVDLISEWHDGERVAEAFIVVPYDLPRHNCATYFPEANVLVPLDSIADRSHTPTSKSVIVRVRPR